MSMGSDTAHDADTLRVHHDLREQHIHLSMIKAAMLASERYGRTPQAAPAELVDDVMAGDAFAGAWCSDSEGGEPC